MLLSEAFFNVCFKWAVGLFVVIRTAKTVVSSSLDLRLVVACLKIFFS